MFYYCCSHESKVDILEEEIKEMNKQINNIYDLLEVLTNESKSKNILEQFNNNVSKEDYTTPKATFFVDKTTV